MGKITQSSDVKDLFSDLLVTSTGLKKINTYYTNLSDNLISDLNALYNDLASDVEWMENKLKELNVAKSKVDTTANNFTANTKSEADIIRHAKYKELLALYNKYITAFYARMTDLESTYEKSFLKTEVEKMNSSWKFHYNDNVSDAIPVKHTYASMNITQSSDLIEITNNRYIFRTEENQIVDADYKTKDCYVIGFDGSTFFNKLVKSTGSAEGYYGNESAKIIKLFKLNGKSGIYVLIDLAYTNATISSSLGSVVGESTDGAVHIVVVGKYDYDNKSIDILLNSDSTPTSILYIREEVLRNNEISFVKESYDDFYLYYISKYLVRFKVEGSSSTNSTQFTLITSASKINAAVVQQLKNSDSTISTYILVPTASTSLGIFDVSKFPNGLDLNNPTRTVQPNGKRDGEQGIIYDLEIVKMSEKGNYNKRLFIVTDSSIIWSDDVCVNMTNDTRVSSISANVNFKDKTKYAFGDNTKTGYFYYLDANGNSLVYCAKGDTTVSKPTRYADSLFFLKNDTAMSQAGYVYKDVTDTTVDSGILSGTGTAYAFIKDNIYCALGSKSGNVARCDITTGDWLTEKTSIVGNKTVSAVIEDSDGDTLYIATGDGNTPSSLYKISKTALASDEAVSATLVHDIGVGTIFAMTIISGIIYLGGYSGRVSAYELKTNTLIPYNREFDTTDGSTNYCVNDGTAIGNNTITCMVSNGADMFVFGNSGKVASCNTTTKYWTKYDGTAQYASKDSIVYNDGTITGGKNITACYNYLNTKLLVFAEGGRVASCNLATGSWTSCEGINIGSSVGPGIHNNGTFVNQCNITAIAVSGSSVICGTDKGYIGSIDPSTGGITNYNGLSVDSAVSGPGIHFDGSGFSDTAISNICPDLTRGQIIFNSKSGLVRTYDIENSEIDVPNISKLYYVGRTATNNDFLSSLLVQISTEEVTEFKTIRPPRESDDVYSSYYDNTYFVYRNGNTIYRISSDFKLCYVSVDGGTVFKLINIQNTGWIPTTSYSTDSPIGYVTPTGELGMFIEANKSPHFLFTKTVNGVRSAAWYSPSTYDTERAVKQFDILQCGQNYLFYIMVASADGLTPKFLKFNSTNQYLVDIWTDIDTLITTAFGSYTNIRVCMDSDSKLVFTTIYHTRIVKVTLSVFGMMSPALLTSNPYTVIVDDGNSSDYTFFKSFMKSHAGITISSNSSDFAGFYTVGNNIYNYLFTSTNGNIYIISLVLYSGSKQYLLSSTNSDVDWNALLTTIPPSQYAPVLGKNRYTDLNKVTTGDYTLSPKYLISFDNGLGGFAGLDVSYYENYGTFKAKLVNSHIVISLHTEVFGKYISNEYRVFKTIDNCGHLVTYDHENKDAIISAYTSLDVNGRIRYTNSIHKFTEINSARNTQLRSLADSWYGTQVLISKDITAFAIKCKLVSLESDSMVEAIDRQDAMRFQVLISSEKTGKFILYEVEKSPVLSRTDRETKTIEPLFKIKAIDRFDDHITELYTSRISGRQSVFSRVYDSTNGYPVNFTSAVAVTRDYAGFVRINEDTISSLGAGEYDTYSIRIRPMNTLNSTIDAQFSVIPYTANSTGSVSGTINNVIRSEYRDLKSQDDYFTKYIIGDSESYGFIDETLPDSVSIVDKLHTTNHRLLPQINAIDLVKNQGYADTYCVDVIGNGDGTFNKVVGIIMRTSDGWKLAPYSVNRKHIDYEFDETGSKSIESTFDIKLARAGRNIGKMHSFGIFAKNVINDADYYTDYGSSSRLAKSDGTLVNEYGMYESVSTLDGSQKRFDKISESAESNVYRTSENAYDKIKSRVYGKSYDIVDRFSIFELPYYYIQAWWIPAKGYITRGNERLLTYDSDESEQHYRNIGRKCLPFDNITSPSITAVSDSGNEGGGIGSSGTIYDSNTVAFSTLLSEKYPLEHWDGFNDLDFVRKWQDTYIDRSTKTRYVVEKPKDSTGKSEFTTYYTIPSTPTSTAPTVARNLYYYNDNFESDASLGWERRGTQMRRYMTGYYYDSYGWKIYLHEVYNDTYAYPSAYDGKDENLTMDKNLSVCTKPDNLIEKKWYIPATNNHGNANYYSEYVPMISYTVKPTGYDVDSWPRSGVVAEQIISMTTPTPDLVAMLDAASYNYSLKNNTDYSAAASTLSIYRRGLNVASETLSDNTVELGYAFISESDSLLTNPTVGKISMSGVITGTPDYNDTGETRYAASVTSTALENILSAIPTGCAAVLLTHNFAYLSNNDLSMYFGASSYKNLSSFLARSYELFGIKGGSAGTQIENLALLNPYLSTPSGAANYGFDNNIGQILPFKFSNGKWINSGFDNTSSEAANFTASIKIWNADCTTSVVVRNPVIETGSKTYDRYCGGDQHQYHYGTKKTVTYSLNGAYPKSYSKVYYKYTSETPTGGSAVKSTVKSVPIYWDVRVPTGVVTTDVVDKEYVSVTTPTNANLNRTYTFISYLNDGTCKTTTETYSYAHKWIKIVGGNSTSSTVATGTSDTLTPSGTDNTTTDKNNYTVTCTEYYQWADGYVYTIDTTHTLAELSSSTWGVNSTLDIAIGNDGTNYTKTYTVVFTGESLLHTVYYSANETAAIKRVDTVLYAATTTSAGTAGTRAIKWQGSTGISGT